MIDSGQLTYNLYIKETGETRRFSIITVKKRGEVKEING